MNEGNTTHIHMPNSIVLFSASAIIISLFAVVSISGNTEAAPIDSDMDGLIDTLEKYVYHTDLNKADTDGDGMPDGYEVRMQEKVLLLNTNGVHFQNDTTKEYTVKEYPYTFDPLDPSDALLDVDVRYLSDMDINERDVIFYPDELTNLQEYQYGSDPLNWDTDGDSYYDTILDTYKPMSDSIEHGVTYDRISYVNGSLVVLPDSNTDWNHDGKYENITNPNDLDTDGDGMPDGWEITYDLKPLNSTDASLDMDSDNLTNLQEYLFNTDPFNNDTDADGTNDSLEFDAKTFMDPILTLRLEPSSQSVSPAPGRIPILNYSGSVEMENPIKINDSVHIDLSADTGPWTTIITPNSFDLGKENTVMNFTAYVFVPYGTAASETTTIWWLSVSGHAQVRPPGKEYTLPPVTSPIYVESYYKFGVECKEPNLECKSGETVTYEFSVANVGNCPDNIDISVMDDQELTSEGYTIESNAWQFEISPGSNATFELDVITPYDLQGTHHVSIKVKFVSKGSYVSESQTSPEYKIVTLNLTITNGDTSIFNMFSSPEDFKRTVSQHPVITVLCAVLLFSVITALAYTRLKKMALLRQAVRKRIYEHIRENPGIHYRELLRALEIKPGTLAHHLNMLEDNEFIKSRQDGGFRRFYLYDEKMPVKFTLSKMQERILNAINGRPGITISDISEQVGSSRLVVSYHTQILSEAGFIFLQREGRSNCCYPVQK